MTEQQPKAKEKKLRRRWVVLLLTAMKVIRVPALCAIAAIVGMVIGYVYMGGEQLADVFHIDTWTHMIDLVFADK